MTVLTLAAPLAAPLAAVLGALPRVPAVGAQQPAPLDREAAREAARAELSRQEYADAQPPLLLRAVGRALRFVGELLDGAAGLGNGTLARVLLVLLLAAVAVAVLLRLGPLRRQARSRAVFGDGPVRTAATHREAAEQLAAQERWAEAVRERLRAVVRELEERGVLDPRPGRTAGEVASEGGAAVPAVADDLLRGAAVFDEVWYGGRPATADGYAVLVGLDDRVRAARTVPA